MIETFYMLFLGHCIADFALQSEAMCKGKNRNRKPENVPPGQIPTAVWPYWLTAHAGIHAAMVLLITQSFWLSLLEFVSHWIVDFLKCDNELTVHQDQFLHITFLFIIAMIFVTFSIAL
jgi:hypothetical protein